MLTYVARNIEKMLIGWYWGAGPVGLYNNADRILLLPIQQINTPLTSVAVPALEPDPEGAGPLPGVLPAQAFSSR